MVELGKPTGISGKEYGVLKRFEKIVPSLNNVQKILDISCNIYVPPVFKEIFFNNRNLQNFFMKITNKLFYYPLNKAILSIHVITKQC